MVERGRIVESGDHDDLLALDGAYAALYREQFGNGTIETTCADGTVFADGRCEYFSGTEEDRHRLSVERHLITT